MLRSRSELRRSANCYSLLARPESNPKVAKNMKQGVMTFPMHLAPSDLSGFNVCPKSTQGCREACLHTAGNPVYMPGKTRARIARTKLYFQNRELFLELLMVEILAGIAKANRANMVPAFRLNATSDIPWERVKLPASLGGGTVAEFIISHGGELYDYTKRANRKLPPGYHLTFSLAENNDSDARKALNNGQNVAVVFNVKRGAPLPDQFMGYSVIDGDLSDYRPADPENSIVGLRAKGDAIGETSGFVRAA